MTALSTEAIRMRLLESNAKSRLIISPLLDAEGQAKKGQAAVDLRLGFDFCLVTASAFGSIGEFPIDNSFTGSFEKLYRREYVPFGSNIIIHPHQFMLAQSLEYLRLPSDLMAYVVGRSTWGRLGLIVATAVGIHPGFAGSLTLELRNLGETPLELFPGQTIAQLFFHSVIDENGKPASTSTTEAQYAGTVNMIPQNLSSPSNRKTMEKLIDRFRKRATH